jgi:hypothetical protein
LIYPTIAVERLRGNPAVEQMLYQGYTSGGFWLQTWLVMPLIRLFGCTRGAVKILPIAFSLGAFVLYFLLARKYFGRLAARLFAGFMILGPPLLLQLQVIGFASHNELGLFWSAGFLCLFWLLFAPNKTAGTAFAVALALGLIGTVSLFYCATSLLFLVFLAALTPLVAYRLAGDLGYKALTALPAFLIGLAAGLLPQGYLESTVAHPHVGYYGHNRGGGAIDHEIQMAVNNAIEFLSNGNWLRFAADIAPRWPCFDGWASGLLFTALTGIGAVLTLGLLATAGRRTGADRLSWAVRLREMGRADVLGPALLALLAVFCLAAIGAEWGPRQFRSPHDANPEIRLLHHHQMVVAIPLLLLSTAAVAARFWRAAKPRVARATQVLVALLLILGVVGLHGTTTFRAPSKPIGINGDSCTSYWALTDANITAIHIRYGVENSCPVIARYARTYDPQHQGEICAAIRKYTTCPCDDSNAEGETPAAPAP